MFFYKKIVYFNDYKSFFSVNKSSSILIQSYFCNEKKFGFQVYREKVEVLISLSSRKFLQDEVGTALAQLVVSKITQFFQCSEESYK